MHRRVGNLRTAQDVNKKSTDAVNNAAGSAFQYLLPALLIRPYIGQTILCEVMSKRNLELSQALQVIPNRLCVRPIGEQRGGRRAYFPFAVYDAFQFEIEKVAVGRGQSAVWLLVHLGLKLELIREHVPTHCQLALPL
jgi:hypothetical protein